MPQGLVALLPALIGAGTAGTEIGLQASGALAPSTSDQTAALQNQLKQQQLQQQQQQTSAAQQAARAAALQEQPATGGFLANPAFAAQVADLIGQPGDIGLVQQTVFNPGQQTQQNPFQTSTGLAATNA